MKNNATKILAGAAAVVGIYFVYKYFRKPKPKKPAQATQTTTGSTTTPPAADNKYPLKRGSRGKLVASVQQWLLKIDKNSLPKFGADGVFGKETEDALKKYLGKSSIDSDADIDKLMLAYQQKTFPLMFPKPKEQTLPTFPSYGFPK